MDFSNVNCRCCYSSEILEMLQSPELDTYKFICDIQNLENDDRAIMTCLQCREFLKDVHLFRIECKRVDGIFRRDFDVKLKNVIEESSQIDIKTELSDEYNDEIDQIDIQINKVEMDSNPEDSQQISNINPQNLKELRILIERCDKIYQVDAIETNSKLKCPERTSAIKANFKNHVRYNHKDEKPYSCSQCNYSSKTKSRVVVHARTHLKDCEKPYKCSKCSYTTITAKFLKDHIAYRHNNEKPFSCDHCNYHTKTKQSIYRHIQIHMKGPDKHYECSECSFVTTMRGYLRDHIRYKHNVMTKESICDYCDYRTKIKRDMINHTTKHHTNAKYKFYKCSKCSYSTTNAVWLEVHILQKHSQGI